MVVSVRMPEELRTRLNRRAEADVRNLSQEIVWLLNYALDSLDGPKDGAVGYRYPEPPDHRATGRLMKAAERSPAPR